MKTVRQSGSCKRAFTLVEITIVILVLLLLIKIGLLSYTKLDQWRLGRTASETLRTVYAAQKLYLADNPTVSVSSITAANLLPYLPTSSASLPTVTSMTGTTLSIIVTVSPPVIDAGGGVTYDPSGNSKDSLWDVGE